MLLLLFFACVTLSVAQIEYWLTTANKSALLTRQKDLNPVSPPPKPKIEIFPSQRQQEIDGWGWCLTGGSAQVIYALPTSVREALLQDLFNDTKGIDTSVLRLSMGSSDMDATVFSYDETSNDPDLSHFSLGIDLKSLVPLLKEILLISPKLKLLATPWSAPTWMKTNGNSVGGQLSAQWMAAYANYFVKYIEEMKSHGIPIWAITPQNEPLNPNNNPSLEMPQEQEAQFIRDHLGPAFAQHNIKTLIIAYDHNADNIAYPTYVLSDAAAKYVDGSAFHLYAGNIEALSTLHQKFPQKNLYFTEQYVPAPENDQSFNGNLLWAISNLIVGATRNWCKIVLQWNLATDSEWGPHTKGGCSTCLGALTVHSPEQITKNSGYYTIGHASKFVPRGSFRVTSSEATNIPNVAFVRPDGKIVLVLANNGDTESVPIKVNNVYVSPSIPAHSVATLVWSNS